ncbi:hypothetical protein BV25DRAFT_1829076 [Artomyces pyxidatus]|uniref:Uncharacterized protein n=1 Tax=Artomyces pyxidatus TaxID=48021 RepID=A0ACB8ST12_9AGAM|nr:hypothetical protein BV25DRAFT_1829076 [Artomyces pyxidatus]
MKRVERRGTLDLQTQGRSPFSQMPRAHTAGQRTDTIIMQQPTSSPAKEKDRHSDSPSLKEGALSQSHSPPNGKAARVSSSEVDAEGEAEDAEAEADADADADLLEAVDAAEAKVVPWVKREGDGSEEA